VGGWWVGGYGVGGGVWGFDAILLILSFLATLLCKRGKLGVFFSGLCVP